MGLFSRIHKAEPFGIRMGTWENDIISNFRILDQAKGKYGTKYLVDVSIINHYFNTAVLYFNSGVLTAVVADDPKEPQKVISYFKSIEAELNSKYEALEDPDSTESLYETDTAFGGLIAGICRVGASIATKIYEEERFWRSSDKSKITMEIFFDYSERDGDLTLSFISKDYREEAFDGLTWGNSTEQISKCSADTTEQQLDQADKLYDEKKYAEAFKLYIKPAENGNASVQNRLGLMYENGCGVEQDYVQACQWYRKAADQGHASAQNNLGLMYDNGHGVKQDYAQAYQWYRKAADQGLADAQNNLGLMYDNGHGVEQDYAQACQWYHRAADQGHASAQNNLGLMYDNGHGVEQDYTQAYQWYRRAADQGHSSAQYNLGLMYCKGHGVEQDYAQAWQWFLKATEQGDVDAAEALESLETYMLEQADKLYDEKKYAEAFKLYIEPARNGNAYAQCKLGLMYKNGHGVEQDYTQAYQWYRRATEQGHADAAETLESLETYMLEQADKLYDEKKYAEAFKLYIEPARNGNAYTQCKLGLMYKNGHGVEQDYAQAYQWFLKAAEQGNVDAENNLGLMYKNGQGVEQDYAQAIQWYRRAAEQGDASAQFNLGLMYTNGQGVEQDYVQACQWYRKAAEQGYASAQNNLGTMYVHGHGVEQDYTQACQWFLKAAEQGDVDAQDNLDVMYKNGGVEQTIPRHASALKALKLVKRKHYIAFACIFFILLLVLILFKCLDTDYSTLPLEKVTRMAEKGDDKAQQELGNRYCIEENYEKAFYWYEKAAEQGNTDVQVDLGNRYFDVDCEKARYWYEKAAENGNAQAQHNLGGMYYDGIGVEQDYEKAFYWREKAAKQGNAYAQYDLGTMYEEGHGVPQQDYARACQWYRKAAKQGHAGAAEALKRLGK